MNILYINHYAGSMHHGMEYRPYYLAREWVKAGHNVTIVAANYSHVRQKNITLPENANYLDENIDGINYIWCRTPIYPGNGIKRLINIMMFLYRLRQLKTILIKEFKPDLVISSSTYPFDAKIAHEIARSTGACFVHEVHDLWPLTLIEVGGMSKYHPFIWFMQDAENYAYRHADRVVSILPCAKSYMQEHGMHADKFAYIPNGVVLSDWESGGAELDAGIADTLLQLKTQGRFILGYAGGMGEANALDDLLTSAKSVTDSQIMIVLVGDGPNKASLRLRVINENITNVLILDSVSKKQIPALLSQMNALYIGWQNLPIYRFGVGANKIFDYMLSAKPVIHATSAGNDLIRDANCGISIAAGDIAAITSAICQMAKMPIETRLQLGQNGYLYVRQHHDYHILAQQFIITAS